MENVMFSIGIVLAVAAVIYAIVTVFFCIMVYWAAFARCKKLPKLILPSKQHLLFCQTDNWAENNGFHYVGIFQVPMASLAVWENPETSSFFVQYLSFNGSYFEFGTLFDNNIYLETGNLLFGLLTYPTLPGFYVQHFPKKSLEEIWELHNESIRYLTEQGNAHLIPFHPDFPWGNIPSTDPFSEQKVLAFEVFQNSGSRSLSKYVRSFFLWSQWWLYWQFFRPFFWVNKTIQEQVEMRRLVLPQELPPDYEKYFVHWSPKKQSDGFEPLERIKLFHETKFNHNTEEPDAKSLYSREYAVEPKPNRNNNLIVLIFIFLFLFFFGIYLFW